MSRYKHLIGPKLHARSWPGQQGEGALAVQVLNRLIRIAKPLSISRRTVWIRGRSVRTYLRAPTPRVDEVSE